VGEERNVNACELFCRTDRRQITPFQDKETLTFIDVRDPQTKQLLFQYDPENDIVRVKRKNGTLREFHLPTLKARHVKQNTPSLSTAEYLPLSTPEYRNQEEWQESTAGAPMGA
jgi:hypothetical protein